MRAESCVWIQDARLRRCYEAIFSQDTRETTGAGPNDHHFFLSRGTALSTFSVLNKRMSLDSWWKLS